MPFPLRVNSSWLRTLPVLTKCINFCSVCVSWQCCRQRAAFIQKHKHLSSSSNPLHAEWREMEVWMRQRRRRLSGFTSGRMRLKIRHAPALFNGHKNRIYPDLPKAFCWIKDVKLPSPVFYHCLSYTNTWRGEIWTERCSVELLVQII